MTSFRVVDCRSEVIDPQEIIVANATSPEDAVFKALGEKVVRSGKRTDLRARVYFQHPNQPLSMVRLYTKVADREQDSV